MAEVTFQTLVLISNKQRHYFKEKNFQKPSQVKAKGFRFVCIQKDKGNIAKLLQISQTMRKTPICWFTRLEKEVFSNSTEFFGPGSCVARLYNRVAHLSAFFAKKYTGACGAPVGLGHVGPKNDPKALFFAALSTTNASPMVWASKTPPKVFQSWSNPLPKIAIVFQGLSNIKDILTTVAQILNSVSCVHYWRHC